MNCYTVLMVLTFVSGSVNLAKLSFHSHQERLNDVKDMPAMYPTKIQDCEDERLMAADIVECVNMNNYVLGLTKKLSTNDEAGEDGFFNQKRRVKRVVKFWRVWPQHADGFAYVPFQFEDKDEELQNTVFDAIAEFNKKTCVRFIPRNSSHVNNYINIINGRGCYSHVGMQDKPQDLSLQHPRACTKIGTAIHEFLHALGFYHTMARRDRDDTITVNFQNIFQSEWNNFQKHKYGDTSVLGAIYDKKSVMHYGNYAFAINGRIKTLTSKSNPDEVFGQRDGFSDVDILQVNRMYRCFDYLDLTNLEF